MSGDINNTDILAALNQTIKAINDICGCMKVSVGVFSGETIEQESGTEGGTPPAGTDDPDPTITDRKCKAANLIVDQLITYTQTLDENNMFNPSIDFSSLGNFLGSLNDYVGLLLIQASMTIGTFLAELAAWLFSTTFDPTTFTSKLSTNKQNLVCALYNASDTDTALADFLSAVTFTADEEALITILLNNNVLNLLFFSNPGAGSELVIDGYTGSVDCSVCAGCQAIEVQLTYGSWDGLNTFTSAYYPEGTVRHKLTVHWMRTIELENCGSVTIDSVSVNYGNPYSAGGLGWRFWDASGNLVYQSNGVPSSPIPGVVVCDIIDNESPLDEFQIEIHWTVD